MARGFDEYGTNNSDIITTVLATDNAERSYSVLCTYPEPGTASTSVVVHSYNAYANILIFSDQFDRWTYNSASYSTAAGSWTFPLTPYWTTFKQIGVVHDANSVGQPAMYLDGVAQSVTTQTTPVGSYTARNSALNVGNRAAGGRVWNGFLAEYAVWNRLLSAEEMAALGKGYSPLLFPRNLVCYLPMVREVIDYCNAAPSVTGTAVGTHPPIIYPRPVFISIPMVAPSSSVPPLSMYYFRQRRA